MVRATSIRFAAIVGFVVVTTLAEVAGAAGAMVSPGDLPEASRAALVDLVTSSRRGEPDAFASLAALKARLPELDERKRGRLATVTPALLGLGKRAVPAMLNELAVDGVRGALSDTAWLAWRLDLLEAVGALRDPRSAPVLEAVLASSERSFLLVRAASQALGKLNSPQAATRLVAASRTGGRKHQLAVLAGMGHCRRLPVVERLADALAVAVRAPDQQRAIKHLARALGDAGNAWAWQTPEVKATGEEGLVRGKAVDALLSAFLAVDSRDARGALTKAILVVDDPSTIGLVEAARARAATERERQALDELRRRVDRNPLH